MPFLNAHQLSKFGLYHLLQQAQIFSRYQASTQIWIIYSEGKTVLLSQIKIGSLSLDNMVHLEG